VERKSISIESLKLDPELYPRFHTNWITVYSYAEAMKTGAKFPPVLVGEYENKLYLIDGWHRVEALRSLKQPMVEAEIKPYDRYEDMFLDAVRANMTHGQRLSVQERVRIIDKFREMGFSLERIRDITFMPVDGIKRLSTRIIKGPLGKPIYLKGLTDRASTSTGTDPSVLDQSRFSVSRVDDLLIQLIELIEHDALPLGKERTKELVERLYMLLGEKIGAGK